MFKVGDKVILNLNKIEYTYGRGGVPYFETGEVNYIYDDGDIDVEFPSNNSWSGRSDDIIKVGDTKRATTTYVTKEPLDMIRELIDNEWDEEREEEDMNKLVDLYYERKHKELTEKYDEKIDNDFNDIEVVKQYKTLIENFEKEQESLFKTIENFDNDYLTLVSDVNCYKYRLNTIAIKKELQDKYKDDYRKELNSLNELRDEVDAQLSLSDDLNYQLEVLTRYNIIDKKTKKLKA